MNWTIIYLDDDHQVFSTIILNDITRDGADIYAVANFPEGITKYILIQE